MDTKQVREEPHAQYVMLPDDMAEAYETFKLSILRHNTAGWTHVPKRDVVRALKALIKHCEDKPVATAMTQV